MSKHENFAIEIKKDSWSKNGLELSMTHNGNQWTTLSDLTPDELRAIADECYKFLDAPMTGSEFLKKIHEAVEQNELAALTDLLANIQECRKLGDFMLRKQINTALELYEEQTKGE